ncbi:hypothetical protein CIT26_25990 [Mesorhizobium temperatum]|uniref:Uncharacterized protein n=1 Tax=Mesorhizobium temperatum TaxID=241416 RepID=A0A271LEQ3_9HYPH|nr:hypothetical protein CIT26_25990 [Mesorhizobium temperatum]
MARAEHGKADLQEPKDKGPGRRRGPARADRARAREAGAGPAPNAFGGDASLPTWLSRIIINEALGRLRKGKRTNGDARNPEGQIVVFVAHVIEALSIEDPLSEPSSLHFQWH